MASAAPMIPYNHRTPFLVHAPAAVWPDAAADNYPRCLRIEFCPLLIVGFLLVGDLDHHKYVRLPQRSPYSLTLSRAFQRLHPLIG
jgi:hypothetical protein